MAGQTARPRRSQPPLASLQKFQRSSTQADERTQQLREQRRADARPWPTKSLKRRSSEFGSLRRRSNISRPTFKSLRPRSRACAKRRRSQNAGGDAHLDRRTGLSPLRLLPSANTVARRGARTSRRLPLSRSRSNIDDVPDRSSLTRSAGLLLLPIRLKSARPPALSGRSRYGLGVRARGRVRYGLGVRASW
jgi:hypothetical protein